MQAAGVPSADEWFEDSTPPQLQVQEENKGFWKSLWGTMSGAGKVEGIQELSPGSNAARLNPFGNADRGSDGWSPTNSGAWTLSAKMALARNDKGRLDILENYLGEQLLKKDPYTGALLEGNQVFTDKNGHFVVSLNDDQANRLGVRPGRYYLNEPGLSMQDVRDVLVSTATFGVGLKGAGGPIARGVQKVAPRGVAKLVGLEAGIAAGSIGQDKLAQMAGSRQGIDGAALGWALALGPAFELGGAALKKPTRAVWDAIRRRQYVKSTPSGEIIITDKGYKEIEKATGYTKETLPESVEQEFKALVKTEKNVPSIAAVKAESGSLPGGKVPLTKGQMTRDEEQLILERQMELGTWGQDAKTAAKSMRSSQHDALRKNVSAIDESIRSGRKSGSMGTGGMDEVRMGEVPDIEAPRNGLMKSQKKLKDAYTNLYNQAESAGGSINMDRARGFNKSARDIMSKEGYSQATIPANVNASLRQLDDMMARGDRVSIVEFERWVQSLNQKIRGSQGTEKHLLVQLRKHYEKFMDRAANGWIDGGSVAASKFKDARALRRKYAQLFEEDPRIAKILDVDSNGEPLLNPQEAMRVIFTGNGVRPSQGASRTVRLMKDILGEDSAEWRVFKQNVFRRMFHSHSPSGAANAAMQIEVSGAKFNTELRNLQNSGVYKEIFSKQEQEWLEQFSKVATRVTAPPPGTRNYSGSGSHGLVALQNYMALRGDGISRMFAAALRKLDDIAQMRPSRGAAEAAEAYGKTAGAGARGARTTDWYWDADNKRWVNINENTPIAVLTKKKAKTGMWVGDDPDGMPVYIRGELRPGLAGAMAGSQLSGKPKKPEERNR